jgi:two component transcriptional regulator, luxR family
VTVPITHAADASIAPITVLLADDDADFRRVYRRLFDASDGFRVLDEAGTVGEAIRKITALHPDVSLVDVQMPGGSGLDVLRGITDSGTRTIMLTAFDLDEYVAGALEWGASGFLLKNASSSDVLSAVRAVHAGHASLAPEITARLMSQFAQPSQPRHPFADVRLSARELQITRLVAQGRSNQQIADELFLSLPTVRTYLRRLFMKLDVSDRTQLAVLAYQAGLLHEPH